MNSRIEELRRKRAFLQERSALERRALAQSVQSVRAGLIRVDQGIQVVRRVLRSPVVVAAGVAVLLWIGPGRILRVVSKSALLLNTAQRLTQIARH